MAEEKPIVYGKVPRRFRIPVEKHPTSETAKWFYGCYFPQTDLIVGEGGVRGTGVPTEKSNPGLEWLDPPLNEWPPKEQTCDPIEDAGQHPEPG